MTSLFASEGGYQNFELGSNEQVLLFGAVGVAVLAIVVGIILAQQVLKEEQGTDQMQEIAGAIQEGALAYLKRQFRTIGIIVIPLAIVVFLTSAEVVKPLLL